MFLYLSQERCTRLRGRPFSVWEHIELIRTQILFCPTETDLMRIRPSFRSPPFTGHGVAAVSKGNTTLGGVHIPTEMWSPSPSREDAPSFLSGTYAADLYTISPGANPHEPTSVRPVDPVPSGSDKARLLCYNCHDHPIPGDSVYGNMPLAYVLGAGFCSDCLLVWRRVRMLQAPLYFRPLRCCQLPRLLRRLCTDAMDEVHPSLVTLFEDPPTPI